MVLGWAIYGTWNWWTWWLHEILAHEMSLYIFFEHEIRRRPTDRREVIIRITRMFFCTLEHEIFLNTNNSNNTNIFWHTDLTHGFFALDVWTRILRITRIIFGTRISFFLHTDLISRIFSLRLVVNDNSLWLLTRCGYWLVVVIDSLWLLTRYGYWLIVVIDLLWLLACYVLNDKSKKISVSHAKHWQIREIRVLKNIRVIRFLC